MSSVLSCVTVLACLEINKYSPNVTIALGLITRDFGSAISTNETQAW